MVHKVALSLDHLSSSAFSSLNNVHDFFTEIMCCTSGGLSFAGKPYCVPSLGLRCVPSMGLSTICESKRSTGDIDGDEINFENFARTCLLDIWHLMQKARGDLGYVRWYDLEETVSKETLRYASVAISLALKKLNLLQGSLEEEEEYDSTKIIIKRCQIALEGLEELLSKAESLSVLEADPLVFDLLVKEAESALKILRKSLFCSQTPKKNQGDGKFTVMTTTDAVEAEPEAENSQLPPLYRRHLSLLSLKLLMDDAKVELEYAMEHRSFLEELKEESPIVGVVRRHEAMAWEQAARKRYDDAKKALKRVEDTLFGNT